MNLTEQILSSLPGNALENLRRADRLWETYKQGSLDVPTVVHERLEKLGTTDWDIVISGGTLGILLGAALVQQGWRVALIERGSLRGRDQEWNISRRELHMLQTLQLLSAEELEQAIASEYNPARIAFAGGVELWVEDVLNVGVDPVYLLNQLKAKFLAFGGKLFENTAFQSATVYSDGMEIQGIQPDSTLSLKTRLFIDVMGHFSPIARQARQGQQPDAVCMVVGTCATGYPRNETGDLFASFTPIEQQRQYFWEAFPARDGRTTYLFTYLDAHPDRPSLEELFADYLRLLPEYQDVELDQLQFQRALFGFFPCYKDSPLRSPWNRILFAGDSSGNQSPLSFGGFGAMIRHLTRLTHGVHEALNLDLLDRTALGQLQPYQPSLSVTWLFQRSMSVGIHQKLEPNQINTLLSTVFQEMNALGDAVLKPFLQDVVQFVPLAQTLFRTGLLHPLLITRILPQVGLPLLFTWTGHYFNLGLFTLLATIAERVSWRDPSPAQQYRIDRQIEAWKYGSGKDYESKLD